jgi:hypothetical protein
MRLPRVRFTVRRLMVAVAIAGLAFGGLKYSEILRSRSVRYRELATVHEFAALELQLAKYLGEPPEPLRVLYHNALAQKYHRAASQPWFLAEPDPPEPK